MKALALAYPPASLSSELLRLAGLFSPISCPSHPIAIRPASRDTLTPETTRLSSLGGASEMAGRRHPSADLAISGPLRRRRNPKPNASEKLQRTWQKSSQENKNFTLCGTVELEAGNTSMDEADQRDIQATLKGDGEAYARIIDRYQSEIARHMWRFSRDRKIYEELVHDVFVEAYLSLSSYQGRSPFLHWLRKIAVRVGYRHWKQQAKQRDLQALPIQEWDEKLEARTEDLTAQEAGKKLHALLAHLPPRDRLVLTLLYLDDCSVEEAARLIGWSQTMVKVQAHRARKKLKKLFEKESPP